MSASDFPVQGDKLKKLVKKSRAMPIAFGFNPGTSDDDDEYLAAHARKPPELLGKMALAEGAGTKSAFGTFAVQGSELHLSCLRTIPQLAKKFKKYLKLAKITLNVVVMDPSGNVIDSDVEVLDDWYKEVEDAEDMADDVAEAVADATEAAEAAGVDVKAAAGKVESGDPAMLIARLKSLQPRVSTAPSAIADKLMGAIKGAVDLIKAGQTGPAAATIAQVEAVLGRVAGMATPDQKAAPAKAEPAPAAQPEGPDPRLPRLREAVAKLAKQASSTLGDGARPLLVTLKRIEGQINAGEAEAAVSGLRATTDALRLAQATRERWGKAFALIEPPILAALSAGNVTNPGDLRKRWQASVKMADDGAWERALASLPAIMAILRAGAGEARDKVAAGAGEQKRA